MVSIGLYTSQDVIIKFLPKELHLIQIVFFRSLFACLPILIFSGITGDGTNFLSTDKPVINLVRSVSAVFALLCFIASFRLIPLAEAYSLTFTTPLFIVALAPILLKEKIKRHQCVIICVGFLGVLTIARPTFQNTLNSGAFIALAGSFFYAVSLILIRKQSVQDTATFIVTTILALSILTTGIALPFVWTPFDLKTLGMFVILGILGGSAQYIMVHAYRSVPIATIAPFDYVSIIWASVFGYIFFDEISDHLSIVGACLIIGSGLYLIRQKNYTDSEK